MRRTGPVIVREDSDVLVDSYQKKDDFSAGLEWLMACSSAKLSGAGEATPSPQHIYRSYPGEMTGVSSPGRVSGRPAAPAKAHPHNPPQPPPGTHCTLATPLPPLSEAWHSWVFDFSLGINLRHCGNQF
ncbi:hypothetical protein NDU88_003334 [Pleurodeles waltl]|uniref:Uncharacterized protein n=1 Tax=Pleurodeles waltl TaxID=8319 RepID=A0AAV7NPE6_PLEWA|nr:hypothetical protein NDU88_003334 [Pleurodeles waltl]